jgi:hypothetical protein
MNHHHASLLNPREIVREVRFRMRRISIEIAPITYKLLVRAAEARGVTPLTALNDAVLAYAFQGKAPPATLQLVAREGALPPAPEAPPEQPEPPPRPRPGRFLGLTPEQWFALDAIGNGDPTGGRLPFGSRGATRPPAFLVLKSLEKRGLTTPRAAGGFALTPEGATLRAQWLEARAAAGGALPSGAPPPAPPEPDSAPDAG